MKNWIIVCLLICSTTLVVRAQQPAPYLRLTLPEALKIAGTLQPDLKNAERNIAYAEVATKGARSGYLPKLILETDLHYNPIIPTSILPGNAFNPVRKPRRAYPYSVWNPLGQYRWAPVDTAII